MTQIKILSSTDVNELENSINKWLSEREGQFIGVPTVQLNTGPSTTNETLALITYRSKSNLSAPVKYIPGQTANPYLSADGKVQVPKM